MVGWLIVGLLLLIVCPILWNAFTKDPHSSPEGTRPLHKDE